MSMGYLHEFENIREKMYKYAELGGKMEGKDERMRGRGCSYLSCGRKVPKDRQREGDTPLSCIFPPVSLPTAAFFFISLVGLLAVFGYLTDRAFAGGRESLCAPHVSFSAASFFFCRDFIWGDSADAEKKPPRRESEVAIENYSLSRISCRRSMTFAKPRRRQPANPQPAQMPSISAKLNS